MPKLTAKYRIDVPPILIAREDIPKLEPIRFATHIGNFIIYPPSSADGKPDGGPRWPEADILCVDITVDTEPYASEKECLDKLDAEVRKHVYRFLRLLRRKLTETPFPLPAELHCNVRFNREKPERGWQLLGTYGPFTVGVIPKTAGVTDKRWQELETELASGVDTELWEDFIVDAKVALKEDDLNRAILYAAIACEIFIKEYCEKAAKQAGISQKFWKYLKSRRPRVPDYYDQVLHLVKGHSLKTENRQMYNLLDQLYEARNRIMHEGKPSLLETKISQLTSDIREAEKVISWVRGL